MRASSSPISSSTLLHDDAFLTSPIDPRCVLVICKTRAQVASVIVRRPSVRLTVIPLSRVGEVEPRPLWCCTLNRERFKTLSFLEGNCSNIANIIIIPFHAVQPSTTPGPRQSVSLRFLALALPTTCLPSFAPSTRLDISFSFILELSQ